MSRRGWALFVTLSLLWGLPYFMIRVAVRQIDPATLVFARTAVAAVVLLPLALVQRTMSSLTGAWRWIVVFAGVEIAIPWYFMGSAERHLTSSLTGLIVASVPLVAIGLSRVLHPSELITRQRLIGLGVGFSGVIVLVGLDVRHSSWRWIGAMVFVVAGYATGPMVLSLKLRHASGLAVIAASVSLVALGYAPWALTHWPHAVRVETTASVAGLGLLCTAGAFIVFFELIKEIGPSRSVVVTFVNTAVAVLIGTLGLHEPLTTGIALGFPLIVCGSFLATRFTSSPQDGPELAG